MKNDKLTWLSAFWAVLGLCLVVLTMALEWDSLWAGMGGGLLGVGVLQLVRRVRYKKDPAYREKVDVETTDERNVFLMEKAGRMAMVLYVLLAAAVCVAAELMGNGQLARYAGLSVGALAALYWLSWLYLRRKY